MKDETAKKIILAEILLFCMIVGIFAYKTRTISTDRIVLSSMYEELSAPDREIHATAEEQKICYLTFDDGPSSNTEKILDILAKYQAKATFFVIGSGLQEEMRPTLERIVEEGHAIGMHANEHKYAKLYASLDSFLADYECLYKTLRDDFGIETAIFRFPGGSACTYLNGQGKAYIQRMHERGFSCFDWNVTGEDSVGTPDASSIQRNVFSMVFQYRHPIVLLHDSQIAGQTIEALPGIIEEIRDNGYRFDSLENAEEYIFPKNR